MLDRLFYFLLALLPPLLVIGAALAARRAVLASQPRRRMMAVGCAAWMGAAGMVLWLVREKIRGWVVFDNRAFDYIFVGALAGLVVVAFVLGLLGVWGRSSRGVPLCPTCWYDMSGHEGLCPECGTTIRDGRELARRRGSATVAAVAVAVQLLAQFLYQYHRADHGGGQGLVPTSVLIAGAFALPREVIVSAPGLRDYSLTGRMADNKLSVWQKTWLAARAREALEARASAETVRRATELIVRGGVECEVSLPAWHGAMGVVMADGGLRGEGVAALVRGYLASRSDEGESAYLMTPRDRAKAATELRGLVPAFERALQEAPVGSEEWDDAIALMAAAGEADRAITLVVQSGLLERSPQAVSAMMHSLSQLGRVYPAATDAVIDVMEELSREERFFSIVWACRVGPESVWMQEAFWALSSCGESNLEVLGAAGLAGSPSTRCEGTDVLIERMAKWRPVASVSLMTLQWPILSSPDDRHAGQLLDEVKRYAVEGTIGTREEAIGVLTQIAQRVPNRREEIVLFLRMLAGSLDAVTAERAGNAVEELVNRVQRPVLLKVGPG